MENCKAGAGRSEKKNVLYDSYQRWAKQNGQLPFAQGRLTRRLNEQDYQLAAVKRGVQGLDFNRASAHRLGRTI